MCRIHGRHRLDFALSQLGHHLSKTVSAIAHRQQLEPIPRPGSVPASRDCLRRGLSAERAFEFIGNDEDLQRPFKTFFGLALSFCETMAM